MRGRGGRRPRWSCPPARGREPGQGRGAGRGGGGGRGGWGCRGGGRCGSGPMRAAPPGAGPVTGGGLGDRLSGDGEGQGEDAYRGGSVQGPMADTHRCARETALVGVTAGRRPSGELVATDDGAGRG